MLASDNPLAVLGAEVKVCFSERSDGTMFDRTGATPPETLLTHRQTFFGRHKINYQHTVSFPAIYDDGVRYNAIAIVDRRHTIGAGVNRVIADGVMTNEQGLAVMLPVADCIAAVVYDPVQRALAVLHLGRHGTNDLLATRAVRMLESVYGSKADDLLVWGSPAIQRASYVMEYFSDAASWGEYADHAKDGVHLDMPGYVRAQLIESGVRPKHIHLSITDTYLSKRYFSHFRGDTGGRQVLVVAMNIA